MAIQSWESALNAKNENNTVPVTPVQPGPVHGAVDKVGNFFSNLAAQTAHMVSYAGTRIAQAGGQVYNEFQNPGYDTPVDTGNPQRQNAGGKATPLPVNAGSAPTNTSNMEAKINQPQQELGSIIPAQQQGATGAEQIAGQGIEAAGTIGGLAAGGILNPEAELATRFAQGVGVGAAGGAPIGAGQAMENGGNAGQVFQGAGEGAAGGAIAGGVLNTALPPIFDKLGASSNATLEATPKTETPTTQTGIADVTPAFDDDMIGQNVMTPDTTDTQGNVVKGKITPRIASENNNLTGERPVTTSASEHAAGTEVNNIPNYPHGTTSTNLEKGLSVDNAIGVEAEGMRGGLQAEDKATPLDTTAEKTKVADLVKSNLPKDIQDKLGYIGKDSPISKLGIKDNPQTALNKQLQDAMGSPEDSLPKTAAGRYYQKVLDAINEYDGTREGKLDLRQTIDKAYKNARGKLAFGSDSQNALDEVNTDIRDGINKDLKSTTTNIDTQASLDKQSKLYRAKDNLYEKARTEAGNKMGRIEQKHPSIKFIKRQIARKGVGTALTVGATAAGVPLITATAKKILGATAKKGKALK